MAESKAYGEQQGDPRPVPKTTSWECFNMTGKELARARGKTKVTQLAETTFLHTNAL